MSIFLSTNSGIGLLKAKSNNYAIRLKLERLLFVNWPKKIFLQQVKAKTVKTFLSILMLFIFLVKMVATVLPALKDPSCKTETSATQFEMDDKDDVCKEPVKSKFEDFIHPGLWAFHITSPLIDINNLFNQRVAHYQSGHHLAVPTPPPNLV